jgi:hypothetical protein
VFQARYGLRTLLVLIGPLPQLLQHMRRAAQAGRRE